jgi:hypothetical protein
MKIISIRKAAVLLVSLVWEHSAHAHGIAGNRYFDGTLTFDDPAVADEAILPYYDNLNFPRRVSMSPKIASTGPSHASLPRPWLLRLIAAGCTRTGQ